MVDYFLVRLMISTLSETLDELFEDEMFCHNFLSMLPITKRRNHFSFHLFQSILTVNVKEITRKPGPDGFTCKRFRINFITSLAL